MRSESCTSESCFKKSGLYTALKSAVTGKRDSVGLKVHSLFVNVEVDKKCSLNFRSVLIRILLFIAC